MGAPKVSRAIFTTSMARTTPAQKPRGLSRRTRFSMGVESDCMREVGVSSVDAVTPISIPCREGVVKRINNLGGMLSRERISALLPVRFIQMAFFGLSFRSPRRSLNLIELGGCAPQDHSSDVRSPLPVNLSVPEHTGERQA